LLILPRSL